MGAWRRAERQIAFQILSRPCALGRYLGTVAAAHTPSAQTSRLCCRPSPGRVPTTLNLDHNNNHLITMQVQELQQQLAEVSSSPMLGLVQAVEIVASQLSTDLVA